MSANNRFQSRNVLPHYSTQRCDLQCSHTAELLTKSKINVRNTYAAAVQTCTDEYTWLSSIHCCLDRTEYTRYPRTMNSQIGTYKSFTLGYAIRWVLYRERVRYNKCAPTIFYYNATLFAITFI